MSSNSAPSISQSAVQDVKLLINHADTFIHNYFLGEDNALRHGESFELRNHHVHTPWAAGLGFFLITCSTAVRFGGHALAETNIKATSSLGDWGNSTGFALDVDP